jgi:hypothetical protein
VGLFADWPPVALDSLAVNVVLANGFRTSLLDIRRLLSELLWGDLKVLLSVDIRRLISFSKVS